MRVALIADVHANAVALEAVLVRLETEQPDQIVCLGDVGTPGPNPTGVIGRLRALNIPVVMGNWDEWLLQAHGIMGADAGIPWMRQIDNWCAAQLSDADIAYLRTFRSTVRVTLDRDTAILCFHGSPRSTTDLIVATTPALDLDSMFSAHHADVLAGGHLHTPLIRRHRDMLIVNPGSLSESIDFDSRPPHVRFNPWAEYALVDWVDGALSITLRRVPLDVELVVQAAFDHDMVHAELWAALWRR